MDALDAVTIADRAVRLGLLRAEQAEAAWDELGKRGGEATAFLKIMEKRGFLTPLQTQKLLKNDTDGYFLGGYRLLYKIASGSFGRVYRADDPSTGRVFAVKVLRKKWSEKKHTIDLFEREGRVGITLRHPNIVEILAVNQDRATKQYYMVMEFVEGGNLREFLRGRKKLEPTEALKFLEEITAGLAFAFSQGITHRDMKTTNVLISSSNVAKLVDFGLADVVDRNAPSKSGPGDDDVEVDRTVDYAGLERATGAPHGDTRSDIFFLGCVAYQLLTGRTPIEWSKNVNQRMQKERFLAVQPMGQDEVNAPPSVFRLIETMMKLNPDERYQTPNQLLEAIREVRRELAGGSGPGAGKKSGPFTIFLVERDERLQDLLREKLKEKGYKVLIASDPQRALDRFRQNPFDVFVVDAATTGDDGILAFEKVMRDSQRQKCAMGGILILSAEQNKRADTFAEFSAVEILVQPVKFKELLQRIGSVLSKI